MSDALDALDPLAAPLSGTSLIEASAGTGKTYTIAALYLRLLLEAEYRVDQIAVVTFTNAATEELKQRIRARLIDARAALAGARDVDDDPLLAALLQRVVDRDAADRRLLNALRGFDEAAVYTIHSFCQRVIKDRAFASGLPFGLELSDDLRTLEQEIAEDFWRRQFYRASPLLVDFLLRQRYTPQRLLAEVRGHFGKPYLKVLSASAAQFADAETAFEEDYRALRAAWSERGARRDALALLASDALNRNKFRPSTVAKLGPHMDDYLLSETARVELFAHFELFTRRKIGASVKKNKSAPEHPLFALCERLFDRHAALTELYAGRLKSLRAELLRYGDEQLAARKLVRRQQSYDDLLNGLHRALQTGDGAALAASIRKRYRAALIDEFQDTDPTQYGIFRAIYADSDLPVFYVGDPKQAIYSFRGADVFAYLQAHRDAAARYTLDRNWRSEPALIDAVNALFGSAGQPFLYDRIEFYSVKPGDQRDAALRIDGAAPAPLRFWFGADADAPDDPGKPLSVAAISRRAARASAADIARLLNLAARGRAQLGGRPLHGGDIAVLVRTHRQGKQVREALLALGVPSVQHASDNVFASADAEDLERLLRAAAEPSRETLVRAALATGLLGLNAAELYRCLHDDDGARWDDWLLRFHDYHGRWRDRGFMPFLRVMLDQCGVAARLLSRPDGERRLANINHLAELLQTAAHRGRLGPEGLLKWLTERRSSADSEDEQAQLRLESDERLVQIVTVHKSKGLEYPLVYCPFLWDGKLRAETGDALSFHDPDDDHRAAVDFGSERLDQHRAYAKNEELAENLRLLYVALTRAKQRCTVVWGKIRGAGQSAPAWLLHRPGSINPNDDAVAQTDDRYRAMTAAHLRAELERLAAATPHAFEIADLPDLDVTELERYRPRRVVTTELAPRRFRGEVGGGWRIASFSALSAGARAHGAAAGQFGDAELAELPDHDAALPGRGADADADAAAAPEHDDAADFPRGARAGSCLHALLEQWPFECDDDAALRQFAAETIAGFGFATSWAGAAAALVRRALDTPLDDGGLRLRDLGAGRRLIELEFYYPLERVDVAALRRALATLPEQRLALLDELDAERLHGFMKGYIDLTFEADGRFYLLDYKSNWLGAGPDAYHRTALDDAMTTHDYWLQSLIYTVALHRYLRLRLSGYDYRRHFGGVYYLFLRGMRPERAGSGVFYEKPDAALIDALDRCFDGERDRRFLTPPQEDAHGQ